ncbi:ThuA domain-containing protein [Stieleria sp. JC731]|uniref:ThuA domain-containing protein n=1 Tax=Pirellulaceae TaxID=2691357 RepID=UPI001E3FBC2F|nr:ThuA domain-containing protein [Stieleria sp. JC731]MCC9603185.1 ThuA domain-containing protein [Stieleria sp. JC731]
MAFGRIKLALSLFALTAVSVGFPTISSAQDNSWEKQKAERFKALSETQKHAISDAVPEPVAAPKKDRRVLVFYRCNGFIHTSIPHANESVRAMGEKTGAFEVDFADTYDVFTEDNLAKYDAILLNNTTHMEFPTPTARDAFMDFILKGKGLVGFHAASDNFNRHPDCLAIVGGTFAGHPWGAGGKWAFKLDDPDHTLNAAFKGQGFWHSDEIYQYNPKSYVGPEVLRILVSLDMTKDPVSSRIDDGPREVPVSWVRTAGEGRVFYTNFGHREDTFANPVIVKHMLDGIQYALGDLEADAIPSAKIESKEPAFAPER